MRNKFAGTESYKNSTNTALGISATFTGDWEDCSAFATVACAVRADQDCDLYIDFTSDSTFAMTDSTLSYKVSASINEVHRLTITRRFFRIRVVNGASAQTYLSISTLLGDHPLLTAPLNLNLGLDADATTVRSTIASDEIVIGRRTGVTHYTKFGHRDILTAASGEEIIWDCASSVFVPMTTGETFTITYNAATDGSDAGATGAKTLLIEYIDSAGLKASASHTLSDTGSDVTSFSGLGINRVAVSSSGTSDYNVNDITISATTSATDQACIQATQGVTQQLIYFVDSNSVAVGKYLWFSVNKISGGGAPRILIKGYVWNRAIQTRFEVFRVTMDTGVDNLMEIAEPVGFKLNATDVLYFVADTDTNNSTITGRFSVVEYKND